LVSDAGERDALPRVKAAREHALVTRRAVHASA
jgi:hypothetical protein